MTHRARVGTICITLCMTTLGIADTGWAWPGKPSYRKQLRGEFKSLMKSNPSLRATYKAQKSNYEVRAKLVTAVTLTTFAAVSCSTLAASIATKNGDAIAWNAPIAPGTTGMAVWAWKDYRNAKHAAMKATAREALLSGIKNAETAAANRKTTRALSQELARRQSALARINAAIAGH